MSEKMKFRQDETFDGKVERDGDTKYWIDYRNGKVTYSVDGFVSEIQNVEELIVVTKFLDNFVTQVSFTAVSPLRQKFKLPIKLIGELGLTIKMNPEYKVDEDAEEGEKKQKKTILRGKAKGFNKILKDI